MKEEKLMAHDPLADADAILSEEYYGRRRDGAPQPPTDGRKARASAGAAANGKARPTHYKVICISMYTKDLEQLDELVEKLKTRGITKGWRGRSHQRSSPASIPVRSRTAHRRSGSE